MQIWIPSEQQPGLISCWKLADILSETSFQPAEIQLQHRVTKHKTLRGNRLQQRFSGGETDSVSGNEKNITVIIIIIITHFMWKKNNWFEIHSFHWIGQKYHCNYWVCVKKTLSSIQSRPALHKKCPEKLLVFSWPYINTIDLTNFTQIRNIITVQ